MDNMLQHPWTELQVLIKEKWLTQKAFASILWKKVSEVNELLKWKRNITIQRDYLLHQTLWTPIKYWILKQVDYDYSLIDFEENPSYTSETPKQEEDKNLSESPDISPKNKKETNLQQNDHPENLTEDSTKIWNQIKPSSSIKPSSEWQKNDDEDFKTRARIFRSF